VCRLCETICPTQAIAITVSIDFGVYSDLVSTALCASIVVYVTNSVLSAVLTKWPCTISLCFTCLALEDSFLTAKFEVTLTKLETALDSPKVSTSSIVHDFDQIWGALPEPLPNDRGQNKTLTKLEAALDDFDQMLDALGDLGLLCKVKHGALE
jgi:hypothetical protein